MSKNCTGNKCEYYRCGQTRGFFCHIINPHQAIKRGDPCVQDELIAHYRHREGILISHCNRFERQRDEALAKLDAIDKLEEFKITANGMAMVEWSLIQQILEGVV